MLKFFDLKRVSNPYTKYSRQLWLLNPPKPEIVIGNNTALFAVLASLEKHGKPSHPNLRLICPEFWLDKVHPFYLNEKWGQTKTGLPKIARDILTNMYPEQTTDDLLTLKQIQELRVFALNKIQEEYHVPVYFGEPHINKLMNKFEIKIRHEMGESTLLTDEDTHFYFWYKVPKLHSVTGLTQKPNTEIYQIHPSDIPENVDIITLGGGLSAIWLAKHFANASSTRKIICIKYKRDSLQSIPANQSVDLKRIITLDVAKTDIRIAENTPNFAIAYSHEYQREFKGIFYTSLGVRVPEEIVKDIPESQVTSPSRWIASRWVAAKNIPMGSLMESILQWFEITNNLKWGFEPQNYHEAANHFLDFVKTNSCVDLKIDALFFHALETAIIRLDNPLPDDQVKPFLNQIYRAVYQPNKHELQVFSENIDKLLQQRANFVDGKQALQELPSEFTL